MSWSDIRPFFNTALEANSHEEWQDGFNRDNIPSTIIDKAFHVAIGPITGVRQNHTDQESTVTVSVSTFYKGYAYPQEAIDEAVLQTENIMKTCVNVAARTTTSGILNIVYNSSDIEPIGDSNDNAVVVTSEYSVRVLVAV